MCGLDLRSVAHASIVDREGFYRAEEGQRANQLSETLAAQGFASKLAPNDYQVWNMRFDNMISVGSC